jgi:predicted esterase
MRALLDAARITSTETVAAVVSLLAALAMPGCASEPTPVTASDRPAAEAATAPRAGGGAAPMTGDAAPRDAGATNEAGDGRPAAPWPPAPPAGVVTDWCIDGVTPLDVDCCYTLPERPTRDLLVYLHGVVPPGRDSPQKTNFETVVANAARRAGAAAILPRGWDDVAPKRIARWWAWPTNPGTFRQRTPAFVARVAELRARLEALTGARFERVWVAGSSSGAYYAAALALHGALPADGYGAMSGGSGGPTPELAGLPPRPFYVGFGRGDSVGPRARALGDALRAARWPVKVAEHDVPHGAREVYLDEAFAFWRAAR